MSQNPKKWHKLYTISLPFYIFPYVFFSLSLYCSRYSFYIVATLYNPRGVYGDQFCGQPNANYNLITKSAI